VAAKQPSFLAPSGDAPVGRQHRRRPLPPRVRGRSPAPRRAQRAPVPLLFRSTFLGPCVVVPREAAGETSMRRVVEPPHPLALLLPHPHPRPQGRSLQKTTTVSRRCQKRRLFGGHGEDGPRIMISSLVLMSCRLHFLLHESRYDDFFLQCKED